MPATANTAATPSRVTSAPTSASEIVPVKGVTLVGPLPKELQKLTIYSAGVAAKSTNAELARGFMAFLTRSEFRAKFAEAGLDYKE